MTSFLCVDLVSPRTTAGRVVFDVVRNSIVVAGSGLCCLIPGKLSLRSIEQATGVPPFVFLAFLAWRLKRHLSKLQRTGSEIMATYHGFLCVVTALAVLRSMVQVLELHARSPVLWNLLWILTRFGERCVL